MASALEAVAPIAPASADKDAAIPFMRNAPAMADAAEAWAAAERLAGRYVRGAAADLAVWLTARDSELSVTT
ncbi:MAG: hypothetical protein BWZ10_03472 [candidate division BRC1 bacterium ADurb.BinA364]|nr:MAG: hypothetical protein BWZ10_03472 [candidate division BRC1 bacterium ADurb.BinA364]